MVRIGYVSVRRRAQGEAVLRAAGCLVVRVAGGARDDRAGLDAIVRFLCEGDELAILSLADLSLPQGDLPGFVSRLKSRGAELVMLEPGYDTRRDGWAQLEAAVEAVQGLQVPEKPPKAGAREIQVLRQTGVGPTEIARRFGVSRMHVWRQLRRQEGGTDVCARQTQDALAT
jgi:DNA invertase Pin-like site-specific DNA recombinase